jgi:hypothetical protein
MTKIDISGALSGVSRAIVIEVVYLVGHQIAHPDFSLLQAEIPNSSLNDDEKQIASKLAQSLLKAFEIEKGRTIKEFNDHDREIIGRKLRGFVRENVIDQSSLAHAEAAAFLEELTPA